MKEMSVTVNGERSDEAAGKSLSELVADLKLNSRLIAVELNGSVISRRDWEQTEIREGDRLEIVHFVGGG